MDFLVLWIPTFVMGFILAIAGVILWIYNVRVERREAEERDAKLRSIN